MALSSRDAGRFWIKWTVASSAGAMATLGLALAAESLCSGPFPAYAAVSWMVGTRMLARMPAALSIVAYRAVSWVLAGVSVGFLQWLAMRRLFLRSSWWILASASGWAAGGVLATLIDLPEMQPVLIALSLGTMQWFVLRNFPRAGPGVTSARRSFSIRVVKNP